MVVHFDTKFLRKAGIVNIINQLMCMLRIFSQRVSYKPPWHTNDADLVNIGRETANQSAEGVGMTSPFADTIDFNAETRTMSPGQSDKTRTMGMPDDSSERTEIDMIAYQVDEIVEKLQHLKEQVSALSGSPIG